MYKMIIFNVFFAIVSSILSGCLTPVKTDYSMKYYLNPNITEQKGEFTGLILAIRGLNNSRAITSYITFLEQGRLYYKEELEWAEHPVEVIERLITKAIEKTGRFKDVSKSIEVKNPDLILTGEIEKFYCVRDNKAEKVLITLIIRIREAKSSKIIFNKNFNIEKVFNKEVEQINEAMDKALSELSQQFQSEINKMEFNENIIK